MSSIGRVRASVAAVACLVIVGAAGCAASQLGRMAAREEAAKNWDKAVLVYAKLAVIQPANNRWQIALSRTKLKASQVHFEKAKKYNQAAQLELAIGELQQVVVLDPANSYAQTVLEVALQQYQKNRAAVLQTEMERLKEATKKSQGAPLLDPRSNIPVGLLFTDQETGKIYDALSKATGINFLYDPKLELKKKISIELTNVPFEKAMETLMLTNKHFFKVMDENTILIADDNQQKRREYEDEVIKTFYLSNADVKDVQSLLRTMLDARKVIQNNQLNAITIRDTPNKIAIAQKIIEANDKAKAELVVDVELLEVSRTISKTLGINLTPRQFNIQWEGPERLPLNNLGILDQLGLYTLGPIPRVTLDFLKTDSGTRVIAKPQLRVTEGEKANLHIGDSVPLPTTTFNTTGTVGGSVVPITSYTYQEVGIVIEIEPRVHHNREVTMKLNVEVSQLGEVVESGQPSINTRQINTVIRLRDGETNLLAGLIRDDGVSGRAGVAGLMDIPGLGKIFSTQLDTRRETDLILTLSPHIIRIPDIRQEDLEALWIGNEANPRLRGEAGSVFATPFTPYEEEPESEEAEEEGAAAGQAPGEPAVAEGAGQPAAVAAASPAVDGQRARAPAPGAAPQPTGQAAAGRREPPAGAEEPLDGSGEVAEEPVDTDPTAPQTPQPPALSPADTMLNLSIAPAKLSVIAGGTFSVNLLVNNVVSLQRVDLVLTYDPTTVEFDSGLEGIIMRQDGTQTQFSAAKIADGQARVEIARLGGTQGIARGGALAALRFRALAGGKARLAFGSVMAQAFDGTPLKISPGEAEITVSN